MLVLLLAWRRLCCPPCTTPTMLLRPNKPCANSNAKHNAYLKVKQHAQLLDLVVLHEDTGGDDCYSGHVTSRNADA